MAKRKETMTAKRSKTAGRKAAAPVLTLIIPVYNEEKHLPALVRALIEVPWPGTQEWIFVDDASRDGSLAMIQEFADKHPQIRFIAKERNEGKGSAIRTGIDAARGRVIAIQDADLEYDPRDLLKLVAPILEDRAEVVYGSRFRRDATQVHRTFHRYINVLLTLLSNFCSGIYLSDMESCYKVFRADVLKSFVFRTQRFGFEPEVTAYVAKFPLRILEYPISYFPRSYLQGKKIGWKDGLAALWFIFRFNFLISARACSRDEESFESLGVPRAYARRAA